jgi:hypothetical protein
MRNSSFAELFGQLDERILNLRKQIREKPDPIAIGKNVATFYLDNIARIVAYDNQLDCATDYELMSPGLTLAENCARGRTILRMRRRLNTMLMSQVDRFLNCFGGVGAIAVQYFSSVANENLSYRDWLSSFAAAKRSRRKP